MERRRKLLLVGILPIAGGMLALVARVPSGPLAHIDEAQQPPRQDAPAAAPAHDTLVLATGVRLHGEHIQMVEQKEKEEHRPTGRFHVFRTLDGNQHMIPGSQVQKVILRGGKVLDPPAGGRRIRLHMKNDHVVEGVLVGRTPRRIHVRVKYGVLRLAREDVKRIEELDR